MKQLTSQIHAFGKALMMPISVIAAAGIFLGLAAAMQNPAVTGEAFAQMAVPQVIIGFIRKIAGALFTNLPLFFAVASAIGLAKAEKPTAAFAAVIGYIVMNVGISATLAAKGITAATTVSGIGGGDRNDSSVSHLLRRRVQTRLQKLEWNVTWKDVC